jgi:hypothetical protein
VPEKVSSTAHATDSTTGLDWEGRLVARSGLDSGKTRGKRMARHSEIVKALPKDSGKVTETVHATDICWVSMTEPHLGCSMARGTEWASVMSWVSLMEC